MFAALDQIAAIQIETSSGAAPSNRPGKPISSIQAITSFGRLISASRVPANDNIDFRLVLAASSSMSPLRGSSIGVIGRLLGLPACPGRSVPRGGARSEQLCHPAARRMLLAQCQDRDHDRDAQACAGDAPQKGPEEDGEQYQERGHRENAAGDAWLEVAADEELDQVQTSE